MNKYLVSGRLSALAIAATLAACGGGGGDDPAPVPTPPVVADPTGNCNVPDFIAQTVAQVNAFRAQPRTCGTTTYPAVAALAWNGKLAQAAYAHSADMAAKNYFSHTSQDGRTYDQRVTAAGYTWSTVAENIAAGPTTMAAAMSGWQASEGHCVNLMRSTVTEIGLSCVKGATGADYATYWTMELAKPR